MSLRIKLASGSAPQHRLKTRLIAVLKKYEPLDRWQFTDTVVIDDIDYSHSHPTLTIGAKAHSTKTELGLLSAYLHEQMHWFVSRHPRRLKLALVDLRTRYPKVKVGQREGGARNEESTYLHLLVCFLELEALSAVVGMDKALKLISSKTYYRWIYKRVGIDYDVIKEIASSRNLLL